MSTCTCGCCGPVEVKRPVEKGVEKATSQQAVSDCGCGCGALGCTCGCAATRKEERRAKEVVVLAERTAGGRTEVR